jgi:hypothetical protein
VFGTRHAKHVARIFSVDCALQNYARKKNGADENANKQNERQDRKRNTRVLFFFFRNSLRHVILISYVCVCVCVRARALVDAVKKIVLRFCNCRTKQTPLSQRETFETTRGRKMQRRDFDAKVVKPSEDATDVTSGSVRKTISDTHVCSKKGIQKMDDRLRAVSSSGTNSIGALTGCLYVVNDRTKLVVGKDTLVSPEDTFVLAVADKSVEKKVVDVTNESRSQRGVNVDSVDDGTLLMSTEHKIEKVGVDDSGSDDGRSECKSIVGVADRTKSGGDLGIVEQKEMKTVPINYVQERRETRDAYEMSLSVSVKKQHFLYGADLFVMQRVWERRHELLRPGRRGIWCYTVQTLDDFWNGVYVEKWLEAPSSWYEKEMKAMMPRHPLHAGLQEVLTDLPRDLSICVKTSIVNALYDYESEREIVAHVRFPFHPQHSFTHTRALDDPSSSWCKHASGIFMTGFAPRLTKLWAHQKEVHKLEQRQQLRIELDGLQRQEEAAKARARKRTAKKKKMQRNRQSPSSSPTTDISRTTYTATAITTTTPTILVATAPTILATTTTTILATELSKSI